MKFQKKPVVIDAFQMTPERRQDNSEWPEWLNIAWNKNHDEPGAVFPKDYPNSDGNDELCIFTLEGIHLVQFGDWIIRGVKGELYPCKPDIFEMTYEPAVEESDNPLMAFGQALEVLKRGFKVARLGWNGKDMFLFLVPGSTFKVNRPPLLGIYPEGTEINYHAHIDMKTADGKVVPWLCSQTDALAEDWCIVE